MGKKGEVHEDHDVFKAALKKATADRQFMQGALTDQRFVKILTRFERDIEEAKERLVTEEKKDIEKVQAGVQARRSLLAYLRNAYQSEVDEAAKNLRDFELQNQLFIGAKEMTKEEAAELSA